MTTVKIIKKNGKFHSVYTYGHSGYAESGKDILCASISAIVQTAGLGLINYVSKDIKVETNEDEPSFKIVLPENLPNEEYSKAELILKTCIAGVKDIADEYPKYLKLEVKNDVY